MYVEGGWKPPWEPPPRPRLTPREEQVILWLVALCILLLLIAPIGGATILEAPFKMHGSHSAAPEPSGSGK